MKGEITLSNLYGIWIGENATIAIAQDYYIAFLRINKDLIACILRHSESGIVGIVYGIGINFKAHAIMAVKNPDTGTIMSNSDEAKNHLINHSADTIEYNQSDNKLVYTMCNGNTYNLVLAEKFEMQLFNRINEVNDSLSVAERMSLWCITRRYEYEDGYFEASFDTQKYSILFWVNLHEGQTYCRVGQNGFCEKGWAMLSTICIRHNECRMIDNNLLSVNDFKPIDDCFVVDGCAFPPDGGWYWSVKEVTDDVIYLNGCGGATYEIHRIKNHTN